VIDYLDALYKVSDPKRPKLGISSPTSIVPWFEFAPPMHLLTPKLVVLGSRTGPGTPVRPALPLTTEPLHVRSRLLDRLVSLISSTITLCFLSSSRLVLSFLPMYAYTYFYIRRSPPHVDAWKMIGTKGCSSRRARSVQICSS
jgi:hypothetical protein